MMKVSFLMSLFLLSTNAFSATNWDQLIEDAYSSKSKSGVIVKDLQELKVVELATQRLRFDGFTSLLNSNRIKLVVESDRSLKDTCIDYIELGTKYKFKAKILFNKGPVGDDFNFILDGKNHKAFEFENQPKLGQIELKEFNATDRTPYMDRTLESLNLDVSKFFSGMVSNAILESKTSQVSIDLSKHNALACDLGMGNIKPTLIQYVTYERALPEYSFWMKSTDFENIYKFFNDEYQKLGSSKVSSEQVFNESVLMGWSIANVEPDVKDEVLKKKNRGSILLKALKSSSEGDQGSTAYWKKTAEFIKPEKTMVTQKMPIALGSVAVEIVAPK